MRVLRICRFYFEINNPAPVYSMKRKSNLPGTGPYAKIKDML
jgi:hypothetical protein